jgi:hypothetical protein
MSDSTPHRNAAAGTSLLATHSCARDTASLTPHTGASSTLRTLLCASTFAACSRSSSSISCAAMRFACSAACCVRSLVAAAFCVRAARSSSLNTCAA